MRQTWGNIKQPVCGIGFSDTAGDQSWSLGQHAHNNTMACCQHCCTVLNAGQPMQLRRGRVGPLDTRERPAPGRKSAVCKHKSNTQQAATKHGRSCRHRVSSTDSAVHHCCANMQSNAVSVMYMMRCREPLLLSGWRSHGYPVGANRGLPSKGCTMQGA
jgi:hypothetical protein